MKHLSHIYIYALCNLTYILPRRIGQNIVEKFTKLNTVLLNLVNVSTIFYFTMESFGAAFSFLLFQLAQFSL